ncbi:MAG: putative D-isomer specific 2-hydroxyacid dehydrogenase NAD-binding [Parcubacteria group bacterium Gr01-1014_48]|nr:MAG: putative D-isomer specific 2-hydroxyacid dehydrogenase NAD-binding [Parcubacteria group bacterium Greene0416_14]TSC72330.1 MAG: putative D-isomer specific 2-hydroxyacid dehydrogenase NAD-binding [Parcubacteria group bacterium Gr01-1014_48]TSD01752.1 MAG: putative D-isomer specific 2-hydroxyacid dehydrogenase NAD-binding [Parcubacteria group bacterium Greene1014_15]TSD08466.1 MAG: putative D-isomer specific 2-hydroxyacid dehydrogenase NAD-binding [Parcubacteria group bacterium Greene0714_
MSYEKKDMTYKILNTITEYPTKARAIIETLGSVEYKQLTQDELLECISKFDIIFVQLGLNLHKDVLDRAKNLKVIATSTTGLDHIDVVYAKEKGIAVVSLRGEDAFLRTITGTAELAFGMLIDLARRSPWAFDSVKSGVWDRDLFRGHNLSYMTLGIVGLGRLGSLMAQYGKAFNMNVIFVDPNVDSSLYKKVSFDEILRASDAISIHVHLKEDTENMFDAKALEKMKPSTYLINTSRGKIVNEDALLEAIQKKKIAGYGTDVLAGELDFDGTTFSSYPLVEHAKNHENVIVLPHIGGMTVESRIATDVFIAKKMAAYLASSV